jgi:hypothetical protein
VFRLESFEVFSQPAGVRVLSLEPNVSRNLGIGVVEFIEQTGVQLGDSLGGNRLAHLHHGQRSHALSSY